MRSEAITLPQIEDDAPTLRMTKDSLDEARAICAEAMARSKRTSSSAKMKAAKR